MGENDVFLTSTWYQLHSMNAKAGEHRRSEPCDLDVTISAIFTTSLESQESYLTNRPLNHLRLFRLHSTFAWIYNAAASLPCVFARLARWQ